MTEDLEPIPDPDSIAELAAVDRATLKKLTRFHTGAELSGLLLRAHNRVGRYLLGERDLPQREKMVVLQAAGISPWLYHELLRAELPEPSPAEILRQLCRDPNHVCAEPFLIELEQALEGIRQKPIVDGPGFEGFAEELAEIEELRHVSLALARERDCGLVEKILDLAASFPGPLPATMVRQLALAIAVWAGISCLEGRPYDSSDAYGTAFDLAKACQDSELQVQLKQRAAHLLAASGFIGYSKVWLNEAVGHYRLTGTPEANGKALVDLGRMVFLDGEPGPAAVHFEKALLLLPNDCFRYRVAALEALSNCYQATQAQSKAAQALDQAFSEYGERQDSYLGYLAWVRARLVRQTGRPGAAEELYSRAIAILRRFGSPLTAELAMLDLAEYRLECAKGTKDLAGLVLTGLKEGRYDTKAAQVAAKMERTFQMDKPSLTALANLRRSLQEAGGTLPPRLKPD